MTSRDNQSISVVWFKRDLRLQDHYALHAAWKSGDPVLPVYLFEPAIMADSHYSNRHWRFVWQSLLDMEQQLRPLNASFHVSYDDALPFFKRLHQHYQRITLYSYEEVGLSCTFERDKQLKAWCQSVGVEWREFPYAGVIRGLTHRKQWLSNWRKQMRSAPVTTPIHKINWETNKTLVTRVPATISTELHRPDEHMQLGGETQAHQTLVSFIDDRHRSYHTQISSPLKSMRSCSRLSPYLAWGNLSVRQVYQAITAVKSPLPRSLQAFISRLHWHCHFIQKFESECEQEFRPVNAAYQRFPYRADEQATQQFKAWCEGNTGIPMVDACMRSVIKTGYLNFRMRAMLVSFLTHYLLIDWRRGALHLAQQFLDFEPGIHYPQFQMQAGVTGTNTLRVYNPVKQAQDNDPSGEFIRKWVPEIAHLDIEDLFAPWQIPPLTQLTLDSPLPPRYVNPVAIPEDIIPPHRDLLWKWRERDDVRKEARRVLHRHSNPG